MVMIVMEAHVEQENWQALEAAYNASKDDLRPGILQTFLTHSRSDPSLWQIITIWENQEALSAAHQPNQTPRGIQIFNSVHAQETHDVLDVVSRVVKAA